MTNVTPVLPAAALPTLPPTENDTSLCSHLRALVSRRRTPVKTEPGEQDDSPAARAERRYVQVVRWGATLQGTKRRKTAPPCCGECKMTLARPWACLTCDFVGCPPAGSKGECLATHFADSTRCEFAVDPTTGAIFCGECDDCIYPDSFETLFRTTCIRVEEEHDRSREPSAIGARGRGRGNWRPWVPQDPDSLLPRAPCRGLRPLLNLSQTCFLSSILQALIHNPLLKAYFLSDKHNRHVCPSSRGLAVGKPLGESGSGANTPQEREKGCMCCEMDRAFEEFYNDDVTPWAPISMLYSMWHTSSELEGYGQQDAHSFFLAALDQIHAHAKGQLSSCNCIAHQTFAGFLVSTVTCSACAAKNTTIDPILDIQLDFPPNPGPEPLTLAAMLRRFCAEEKIGGGSYRCEQCGGGPKVHATRKLAIKKLPPVLSFQMKRFAHGATSSKVELPVKFPSHLNMRPYVDDSENENVPESLFAYDLFAVVTHEGKLDNGHYWAHVRSGDEWWHCDDDKVTPTTLAGALAQKAYMLFYVRKSLAYAQPMSVLLNAKPNGNTANGHATANGH